MNWFTGLEWFASVGGALVFYKSALHKAANPYGFREVLRQYRLVPTRILDPVSIGVIVLELCAATWLITPMVRLWGALLGMGLQTIFLLAILARMGSHFPRGCGCFQMNFPQEITWRHALMNIGLLVLLFGLACLHQRGEIHW